VTLRVRAVNAAGNSSTASVNVTPRTTPGTPTSVTGTPGSGTARINWQPPSNNGGSAITGYQVSRDGTNWVAVASTARSHTFSGLTNGTLVTLRVRAVNAAGNSSTASVNVTPRTTPGTPTSVTGTPGSGTARINWQPPSNNGGSAITGYQVSRDGTNWVAVASTARSHTFSGLTNGTSVTLRVRAVNAAGNGSIASVNVTPSNNVTLTFNANGGTPATTTFTRQSGNTIGTLPANPTRTGHAFVGWFNTSAATGGTQITANTTVPSANTTYWARWASAVLSLNTSSWNANQAASNTTVSVTSNITWNMPTSNVSWLTISNITPTTRTGNGSFRINAAENTGTASRSGTITVSGGGISRTITVTQQGRPLASITNVTLIGTPRVSSTLTAAITYSTAVNNPSITFQWQSYNGNGVWTNIAGAIGQTFVPTTANANTFVRVVVRGTGSNISTIQRISDWVSVQRALTGQQVIECFGERGYADVRSSLTATTVECVAGRNAERPIWTFVHLAGNAYAIRNETTGRYLTETNGNLRHESRISGTGINYDSRQRWRLVGQSGGLFRIGSVSNISLYVTEGAHILNNPNLSLSTLNTSNNRQLWRIGYIWHSEVSVVGFWRGTINIQTRTIREQPSGFDFASRMNVARDAWGNALGVSFNSVSNGTSVASNANIRAYGGTKSNVQDELGVIFPSDWVGAAIGPDLVHDQDRFEYIATIRAGGSDRRVIRFTGTGANANIMAVFSGNNDIATMIAMHELGHSLGYWGHSQNSSDIMFYRAHSSTTLRPAERHHLRQIYRDFR